MTTQPRPEAFDTVSSASRQHYIDTGRYLTIAETGEDDDIFHGYAAQLDNAARRVVTLWRRLNTEGPGTPDDLEVALDNAILDLEDALT